jgi:regulator of sigma E protease
MPSGLVFILVLSVLVLIHELGHFMAARLFGIKVEEFAFGLPFTRSLISIKRGETTYSIYPLLFGGFVRLHGEESLTQTEEDRSFWNRGKKQRLIVVAAGVVMNILLALVLFVGLYSIVGVPQETRNKVTLTAIEEDSPADTAGLKLGDRVIAVEGKPVTDGTEFGRLMRSWGGLTVNLEIERGQGTSLLEGIAEGTSERHTIAVTPRVSPPEGQGPLGVGIADYPYLIMSKCSMLSPGCWGGSIVWGVKTTGIWIGRVFEGLRQIGSSLARGRAPEGVAGPVGIYQLTDIVSQEGVLPVIELMAVLSVNLGVFNILPIPALDGGRAFMIVLEWLRKKRVSLELEQKINSYGMAVLLALLALITLQDVIKLDFIAQLLNR